MKTIKEAVDGLSEAQLKDIARKKYSYMANEEVRLVLKSLNTECQAQLENKPGASKTLRQWVIENYESMKKELQGLDLWNPMVDRLYKSALEGKLSLTDLYRAEVKLD